MITLNDLTKVLDGYTRVRLFIPVSPRVTTRIDFNPKDTPLLTDICGLYGALPIQRITPSYGNAMEWIDVQLGSEKKNREEGHDCEVG
jgi:hypothetical protein